MTEDFFLWQDSFSVQNRIIDEQHKQLVSILNELHTMYLNGDENKKIGLIILKLTDYTQLHFKTEEKYFIDTNYKLTDEHVKEHNLFIHKVDAFKDLFFEDNTNLTSDIMDFLKDWLYNHIMVSDQKYVKHFKEHRLSR